MLPIAPRPGSVADSLPKTTMVKPRSKVEKPVNKKKAAKKEKNKPEELKVEENEAQPKEKALEEVAKTPETEIKEEQKPAEESKPANKIATSTLSENADYIALTSALSMLTRQQETSKRDLVKLSQMRQQAVEQPEQFLDKVKSAQVTFPQALYVTMVPSVDWKQYGFENRELDAAIERQKKAAEKGVVQEVPLFNQ